jgi:hypothetical protein
LNAQARPRPRRSAPGEANRELGVGNRARSRSESSRPTSGRAHRPFSCRQPNVSAHCFTTGPMVTPLGSGVPTEVGTPSVSTLRSRIVTGSRPNTSASLFIWPSAAKAACGPPKPRNAPPGTLLV